jgi:hypothetical protein
MVALLMLAGIIHYKLQQVEFVIGVVAAFCNNTFDFDPMLRTGH